MLDPFRLGVIELAVLVGVLVVYLAIAIFFFMTLHRAMSKVHPMHRRMEPGLVWLGMVPILNIVWAFIWGTRVPESLQAEFYAQRRSDGTDYGRSLGMTHASLGVFAILLNCASRAFLPAAFMLLVLEIVNLVVFILFWVRIAGYSALLGYGYFPHEGFPTDASPPSSYPPPPAPPPSGPPGPSDAFRPDDRGEYR